jgi:hypothetical protein
MTVRKWIDMLGGASVLQMEPIPVLFSGSGNWDLVIKAGIYTATVITAELN